MSVSPVGGRSVKDTLNVEVLEVLVVKSFYDYETDDGNDTHYFRKQRLSSQIAEDGRRDFDCLTTFKCSSHFRVWKVSRIGLLRGD